MTTKLKNVRLKYRRAVDSGRRSGHGRVVFLYMELCEQIWSGSPATDKINTGIETTDLSQESSTSQADETDSPASLESRYTPEPEASDDNEATPGCSHTGPNINERRNLLDAQLRGHKKERLKRKLPAELQMVTIAQEEFNFKKQFMDRMEHMDKEHSSHMNRLIANLEKLTGSIADGFAMLRQTMLQSSAVPQYVPNAAQNYTNMYPSQSTPNRCSAMNTSNRNNGHFSYTQSLFRNDVDEPF